MPLCNICHAFVQEAAACFNTYALVTGNNAAVTQEDLDLTDEIEAEGDVSDDFAGRLSAEGD